MVKLGKDILLELAEEGFFNDWKTMNEIKKRLSQRGFTVSGKKLGNIGQTLTRMCRDKKTGFERDLVDNDSIDRAGGKWTYKKVK